MSPPASWDDGLVLVGLALGRPNAGTYSCMAGNRGGMERRAALVCVRMRPSNVTHCGAKHGIRSAADHFMEVEETGSGGLKSATIAIAVGAAGGYILLVICLVGWCAYRRRRGLEKLAAAAADASAGPLVPGDGNASLNHHHAHHHVACLPSSVPSQSYWPFNSQSLAEREPYHHSPRSAVSSSKQSSSLDRFGFPRENIDQGRSLPSCPWDGIPSALLSRAHEPSR